MLSWLEIDLDKIKNNIAKIKKITGPEVKFGAVVKANAYGHGLIEISKTAIEAGAEYLLVDDCNEALTLRGEFVDIPILIIGAVEKSQLPDILENNIEISFFDPTMAQELSLLALRKNKTAKIHLKVDTGMRRLGFEPDEILGVSKSFNKIPRVEIKGIYTHFASAGNDRDYTQKQLTAFNNVLFDLQRENLLPPLVHASNSAATLTLPQSHFGMVRMGIAMYGCSPFDQKQNDLWQRFNLESALAFKTKIVQVKVVPADSRVGYGGSFKTSKESKIAVIAVGYAEGLDRNLSNKAQVLIGGVRCPVIGRICMRMSMVDVTSVPHVAVGDEVVLIGKQGREEIRAEKLAQWKESNVYEILTRIPERVQRIYK